MLKGTFKSLKHQHLFSQEGENTIMTDIFEFESPFGIVGKLFNRFFLKNYLTKFLITRNELIRKTAEQ